MNYTNSEPNFKNSRLSIISSHSPSLLFIFRNGGPIAVHQNRNHLVLSRENDPTRKNICFFNNLGDIISKCPVHDKCNQMNRVKNKEIVGFDFTDEELLVVFFSSEFYWIVDP